MSPFLSIWIAEAWAAAGAAGEPHAAPFFQIIYPLVNFLIFAYLIKRFVLPGARSYLSERRERIAAALKGGADERARAEAMVEEYRGRLGGLENEAAALKERLRQEGERLRARLTAEGEEQAAKIKADADFLVEQELKSARQQLRSEMAVLAQRQAGELLERHLTPEDQRRLVEELVRGVGQSR
jgi:F-type H+-transporting ATPase subunit b